MTLTYGSLFAGVGGFDQGMDRAGLVCQWQVEIDARCRSVLARHWPEVPKYADIRDCGRHNLTPVDVIVGGSPCQGMSQAGKRAGLGDSRSGLWWEMLRVVAELQPRVVVWENVPGVLSRDGGRDFRRILSSLVQRGFVGACRVLDARHFGVPQRRRRVFGVFARLGPGDGGRLAGEAPGEYARRLACLCGEILALGDGVPGHPPAGGEAGAEFAGTVGGGSAGRGRRIGGDEAAAGHVVAAFGGNNTSGPIPVACGLNARSGMRQDFETETLLVGQCHGSNAGPLGTLRTGHDVGGVVPFVVRTAQTGAGGLGVSRDETPTLDTHSSRIPAVFNPQAAGNQTTLGLNEDAAGADGAGRGAPVVAFQERGRDGGRSLEFQTDQAYALAAPNGGGRAQERNIATGHTVRRLTPTECERLQGWPDDWTRYDADGNEIPDGPRYRMIGNGVVEPVAFWIGRRLVATFGGADRPHPCG